MSDKEINKYNPKYLKSVLLLTLAVSGNFVGNTLGCKTQYHMTNNMYVKHFVLFLIIYFTLSFTSDEKENPMEMFKNSLIIWICFLIFTKQNITFTAISAFLFFGTYIVHNFIEYYNKLILENKDDNKYIKINDKLKILRYWMFITAFITLIIGFLTYYKEKKEEYSDNINFFKFIFGKIKCNSLE
jgi:hypothetical protein